MTIPLGTVPANSTLYIPFATYAGSTGASVTMTGLAVTDIEIYKNGSTTQRASDAGYTLLDTDGIDFDGITGIHGFSIDLSNNTDAGFFSVGAFYWVVVSSVTVDSQTVNFIAATFRIGPPENVTGYTPADMTHISGDSGAADLLEAAFDYTAGSVPPLGIIDQGTAQSATSTTLVLRSGITVTDDVMIGATIFIRSSTNGLFERRVITDWVSSTDTATVDAWTQTPTGTIEYIVFATAPGSTGSPVPADVRKWNNTAVPSEHAAGYPIVTVKDGTGTGEIDTTSGGVAVTAASVRSAVGLASANLDTQLDAIPTAAEINAEVVDALATDTRAEPGQGAPGATISLAAKIDYIYKWLRNRRVNDGTDINYYADDATTIDHKQAVADNGSAASLGEMRTGA